MDRRRATHPSADFRTPDATQLVRAPGVHRRDESCVKRPCCAVRPHALGLEPSGFLNMCADGERREQMSVSDANRFWSSPPDVHSPRREIRSWVIAPPGMLNIAAEGTFVTAELARHISVDVEREMKRRHPGQHRFIYVHDFSGVVGYAPEARRILTAWGLKRIDEVERVIVVTPASRPLIRMAISTAEVVLRVAGMRIEVVEDLRAVIERYALH